MKKQLLALACATAALGATANAATIWATEVDWANNGTVPSSNGRDNPNNALGAPDGSFLALGLTTDATLTDENEVGFAVFGFGDSFIGGEASVFEVTFNCSLSGDGSCTYPESTAGYFGNDYDFGSHDLADVLDDFTFAGEILNGDAQNGGAVLIPGSFDYIALIDTSGLNYPDGPSFDGFDVDAVGVSEVPLPGAALLMGSGLLAAAARRARRS